MTGCQTCGTEAAADARFCSQCGARLGEAGPSIDPSLRNQVLSTIRAEHRLVTVVFADMTGSVSRTRHLDAEGATDLVNPLLEAMVELMMHHGGRIDRFLGDGVLAVFGVPRAHEDDPVRAIRAALGLRERAGELGLDVTVGVNTGRVYFGPVGSSLHEELTVMGPVVNLAARLQGAAGPGEVIVGESTGAHIRASFEMEPRTIRIKGIDDPVEAFAVTRLSADPDKVRGIDGLTAQLVGREAELSRLVRAIDDGRTVAAVGEAGLGKTRLFREARRAVSGRTWMEGRFQDLTSSTPFSGFADLIGRQLGGTEPRHVQASLEALPTLSSADIDEILPFLVHVLGRSLGDERDRKVIESDPSIRSRLTTEAINRWLTALSELHPLTVFLDDLHWADPLSIEALAALDASGPSLSLAVAARPSPSTRLDSLDQAVGGVEQIHLNELDTEQTRELIRRLLAISGLPPHAETRVVEWARGNPFYVEELLRSLIQREMIVNRDGGWEPGPVPIVLELPESIDGLVMSRFDRLPTEARRVAQAAAVLDRAFSGDLLAAIISSDATPQLEELADAGFLERSGSTRHFTHDLVREAIYQSLLPSQQLELHELVGRTIRGIDPDDHETLAYHFERSADHEAAVEELLAAATGSFDGYANDTALERVERGLARIAHLRPDERDRWTAGYLLLRARLSERASMYDGALADLIAARELVEPRSPPAIEVLGTEARVHRMRDEFEEAFAALDEAEAAIDVGLDPRSWIALQEERAHALYFGSRGRELPDLIERLRPVVEAHGTTAQHADLIGQTAFHRFITERFKLGDETVALCRRALDLTTDGDPGRFATAEFRLGFGLLWADRSDEAIEHLERSHALSRRSGDAMLEIRAGSYLAIAHRRVGRAARALAAAEAAHRIAVGVGDSYYVGHNEAVLGWAHWQLGNSAAAQTHLHTAIETWGHVDADGTSGIGVEFAWLAAWPLAAIALERDDTESAIRHLRLLTVPWERMMPPELDRAVAAAVSDPSPQAVADAIRLAHAHSLV